MDNKQALFSPKSEATVETTEVLDHASDAHPADPTYPRHRVHEIAGCCVRPLTPADEPAWHAWRARTALPVRPQPTEAQRVADLHTPYRDQLFYGVFPPAAPAPRDSIAFCVRLRRNPACPAECFFDVLATPGADAALIEAVVPVLHRDVAAEGYTRVTSYVCPLIHPAIVPVLTRLGMTKVGAVGSKTILQMSLPVP